MIISRKDVIYAMSAKNKPVAHVDSGSVVTFETYDCFANQLTDESQTIETLNWDKINPATGPIYINEAKENDVLKVEILDIKLADCGTMVSIEGEGTLGDIIEENRVWRIPVVNDQVAVYKDIMRDIEPMIGVIGVAPKEEIIATGTPGAHGGNMDNRRIKKGTTLYLPVNVDGALLAMGDLHALMADGEVLVCGLEINGEVTVKVSVIKNETMPLPMLVDEDSVITIASEETLDKAVVSATYNMQKFIKDRTLLKVEEVIKMLTLCGNLGVCQIVDPLKTARMEFPKELIEKLGIQLP